MQKTCHLLLLPQENLLLIRLNHQTWSLLACRPKWETEESYSLRAHTQRKGWQVFHVVALS
jgi:hypothetical protein